MSKIRIGIVGYGNLGKGVLQALEQNQDMKLVGIFSRRELKDDSLPFYHIDDIMKFKNKIDVLILCGGSFEDLPKQGPKLAKHFSTIDSFDTHAKIPDYFKEVDKAAKKGDNVSIISVGWDPGLFSINRVIADSVIPEGKAYTFWGKGLSQGHSDAIRRVPGVKFGVQYTVPKEDIMQAARDCKNPDASASQSHDRECFIVACDGADKKEIENTIKNMPNYFADYNTIVHFIDEEEFKKNHSTMPHGGFVIRSGESQNKSKQVYEFSLKLESNPEFTANVLLPYARAAYRLKNNGNTGAFTVLDIAPSLLSEKSSKELRKEYL